MENKRGQLTLFIILGIIILLVLFILLYPRIKVWVSEPEPGVYIEDCTKEAVEEAIEIVSFQGGGLSPENYILYSGNKIEYLCYTNNYYEQCKNQKPLLHSYVEEEISKKIEPEVKSCLDSLKQRLEKKGNRVSLGNTDVEVELVPGSAKINIKTDLIVSKGETSNKFESFKANVDSSLYNLISISTSILNWEARYGDSETTVYMYYYPDVKVEKKKQSEGSTVYILTDRITRDKFLFASRSMAYPAGYGLREVLTHTV